MMPMLIPAALALFVFMTVIAIGLRHGGAKTEGHQKTALNRLYQDNDADQSRMRDGPLMKRDITEDIENPQLRALMGYTPVRALYALALQAGYEGKMRVPLIIAAVLFVVLFILITRTQFALLSPFIAFAATWFLMIRFMKGRVRSRNVRFIEHFPDAIDTIVRSVRAGHPMSTTLRMIAENSEPPVSTEFTRVVDEVSYGRSLIEALNRLSDRINESDLQFFVVVLSVQQETGSNLAEVLTNLSNVIRKRKQLRLKIRAMTSEGRATSYVLGGLPLLVFGALMVISPNYLKPLFYTGAGNVILASAAALIVTAFLVVRQMVDIEI